MSEGGWFAALGFGHVARVHWIWGVAVVVVALWWLERRGAARFDIAMSPTMQARLATGPSRAARRWRLAWLALAMAFAVLALMRPQLRGQPTAETFAAKSADIMVALDVSKSMLAEDVAPNRLARAKADIARLATRLAGARLGLVVFAGRAAVACPLTMDDAFFRFALRDVDTNAAGRGGTRLGEALRVATKAFPPGLGAKLLVLITDGEDQDSYPIEAAKEAAAAGIRVIAIGLGSEEGSQIAITDPATGAKQVMMHDGAPVISRIDGAMLQQIADATGGAFVPAKTAAIDLESIVSKHIVPMLRDEAVKQLRTSPRELYPWCLLAALGCLLGAVWLGGKRAAGVAPRRVVAAALVVGLALGLGGAGCAADGDGARLAYNKGVGALAAGELDAAEAAFTEARSDGGADVELRFSAAYNLAMVAVARADAAAVATPPDHEATLQQLRAAEGWLQNARALRPTHPATLENLHAIKQRMVALIAEINKGKNGLEARLDAAIAGQRALRDAARGLQAGIASAGSGADPLQFAPAGAKVAAQQQALLAEAGVVSDLAAGEIEALGQTPQDKRTPEQAARLAQLGYLDQYVALARSAMVDARRLAQDMRAELAASRSADALEHLKRAREQLMDPLAVLQQLAADQVEQWRLTAARAGGTSPAWVTEALLLEAQRALSSRLREARTPLEALAAPDTKADTAAAATVEEPNAAQAAQRAALVAKIRQALPYLAAAGSHMERAETNLTAATWSHAATAQEQAATALALAMEQFADARQMIDLAWSSQHVIGQALQAKDVTPELARQVRDAVLRNGERLTALAQLLDEERARQAEHLRAQQEQQAAPATTPAPSQPAPDAEQGLAARFAKAQELRAAAKTATAALQAAMARGDQAAQARAAADAMAALTELRSLFFTVIEHLKQLARDQAQTRDQTTAAADAVDDRAAQLASPLAKQETHFAMADAVAQALAAAADAGAANAGNGGAGGPSPEQWRAAAQEVGAAKSSMQTAVTTLRAASSQGAEASVDVAPTLEEQASALEHLANAIAILEPPQPKQDPPQKQQDGKTDQDKPDQHDAQDQHGNSEQSKPDQPTPDKPSAGQGASEPKDKPPSQPQQPAANALQRAQEREAERRRNQPRARAQPVEKDW